MLVRRAPRSSAPMSPEFAAWPAAFSFEILMGTASSSMAGRRSARMGGVWMRTPSSPGLLMFTVTCAFVACADASLFTASLGISLRE